MKTISTISTNSYLKGKTAKKVKMALSRMGFEMKCKNRYLNDILNIVRTNGFTNKEIKIFFMRHGIEFLEQGEEK